MHKLKLSIICALIALTLGFPVIPTGRNKGQKLVSYFLKIGHFVSYQLPSH